MDQGQAADIEDTAAPGRFGEWIRTQRKALWMTQKRLARLVGCAPVTIQKIEEGRRRPSPVVAEALARHLEIPLRKQEQFLQLARTTPTTPRTAPTPAPLILDHSGLPVPPQPIIGRQEALAALQDALLFPSLRLITLTGPPGVGKTRLAVGIADGLRPEFADTLWFVPLAALDDPAQVLPTINRRLGLPDSGASSPAARLIHFLRARQALLVLDNFEHLLAAAPQLADVLAACPGLRLLVTSRTALRLSGEQEWPLAPLGIALAVQLFAARVRAFDPTFVMDARTMSAVSEIVERLEGLPLAIELAAVRLRYSSPEELAARLRHNPLRPLGTGPVDGPARQQTLQEAIAWSYERLTPPLQRVFRSLGVFVGGFEAAAAAAVAEVVPADLEALLDGHLIRREDARFSLLETLRAYALERLDEHHEAATATEAHRVYFLSAALARQDTDLDWFEAEVGNLRAALRAYLESGQTETALRLILGIYWFWEARGYQLEALAWFSAILERPGPLPAELHLASLNTGSTMAWQSGQYDLSHVWLTQGIALSRRTGHLKWEAKLLMHQGKIELEQGRYVQAWAVLEPALSLARQFSLPWLVCAVLLQMADVSLCLGDLARAEALAEEGLEICREHPGLFWEAPLLQVVGLAALEGGKAARARQHLLRALQLASNTEHRLLVTLLITDLAATLSAPGASHADLLQATRLWSCAGAVRDYSGYRWSVAFQERFDRWTAQTRQRLEDADWMLAWASGRTMPLQEAVIDLLAEVVEQ